MKCEYWTCSCKQKTLRSDVGVPISITVRLQYKWEGLGANCMQLVKWGGRGSEPTGLDLIIRSAANFRNKMAQKLLAVLFLILFIILCASLSVT